MELKDYMGMNPVEYTDEELTEFVERLQEIHKNLIDSWQRDVETIPQNLSPESFRATRLMKKYAKRYASDVAMAEHLIELVGNELAKRLDHLENLVNLGIAGEGNEISREEFLEREEERTREIRKSIDE